MRLRLLSAALLLPLAVACGSPAEVVRTSALEIVRRAGNATVDAGTARVAMRVEGGGIVMSGSGVSSLREFRGAMTMKAEAAGQTVTMKMRMLDNVVYVTLPNAPKSKPWVKFDLDQLSEATSVDLAALSQLKQGDPTQSLAYLQGVSGDVREDGREDVRGEPTTRYRATIDLTKARDAQTKPEVKAAIDSLITQMGTSTMPATIWIDGAGRMRKMVQDIDLSTVPQANGATGTMTTTFELYDFGTAVAVAAPPAAQTTDGADLMGG